MEAIITARIAAVGLGAFLFNALLTPVLLHIAHRFGWYDDINARKIHTSQTPRIGGIGIFSSFVVAAAFGLIFATAGVSGESWSTARILILAAGMTTMHALGLYDDFVNLPAVFKFLVQLAGGLLVALSGATLGAIELPWLGVVMLPPWLAFPLTALWVVAIANAVNLIDGADGLAGGVALIAALFMGLIALMHGAWLPAFVAFALVGALAGFLVFNLPPARIFMGDSGSLLLGFLLAVLPLLGLQRTSTLPAVVPLVPVLSLLFIPIVDTLLAISRRLARRKPIHSADREHIHHRLIDRGLFGRKLLAIIYSGGVILGFTAMTWYTMPAPVSSFLTIFVWALALISIVVLGSPDLPAHEK